MDATVYAPFCTPLRQRSGHTARPGEEGGVPPKSQTLSLRASTPLSSSSRMRDLNDNCNRSYSAMDVVPVKMEPYPAFAPRPSQGNESLNADQATLPNIVPISVPPPVVISKDTTQSYLLQNVTPYVQQPITVTQTHTELVQQPPAPPPAHLIGGSMGTVPNLPLPHRSISVPTAAPITSGRQSSGTLSHGSFYERTIDACLSKKRDPSRAKEVLPVDHYSKNTPRKLRLRTTDSPSSAMRIGYGRAGWHDGPKHSALLYPGPGGARLYTRPAPSLPLLPLGQTYGRSAMRRIPVESFSEPICYEAESCVEAAVHGFRSANEGNMHSVSSTMMHSTYGDRNVTTYTAAGTAPAPNTFRGDSGQLIICSSTISGLTPTYRPDLTSKCAQSDADCSWMPTREALNESLLLSKHAECVSKTDVGPLMKKEDNQSLHNDELSSTEKIQQICKEDSHDIETSKAAPVATTLSLCPQLAQTHIADVQAHVVAENASGIERSTLDGSSVVTIPTIPSSEIVATSNVPNTNNGFTNSQENISHNSSEAASSVTVNNAADTFDKNKCTLPLAKMHHSKENQTQDVHFLDEDSLLENLPKISQCSSSEQARSQNWMPLRVLSAKRSFETASNDTHFSRQKKQILQMKIPQREIGTAIRGVNERKVGGLSSMSNHQHLSENNWRKNTQISNPPRSFASRPFSTSDGFIHHRERSSSERLYGGTTDLNLDRHHYSSSDGRPTSRTPTSFGSASRSSFGCHDGARSIISGGEGSFEKYFEKRGRGMVVTDCPVYRNARRIGANKSRNFPPVYLALKNRFEFDDNGTLPKSGAIDSSNLEIPSPAACSTPMTKHSGSIALRENGIDQRCVSQQNIRSMSKVITNVEGQMGESLNEQIAVRGKGESGYQSESSSPALHIATEGTCNHVSVHDSAIIESSISTGGSITEEPSIRTADITLDLSSGASTAVQASSELIGKENFELSRLDVLSEEIWYYHRAIAQTESVLNRKLHLRDVLYYAISPVFPMCGLYVVGSSLNGFGTNSSDMDLCLMITNKDLDQRTDAVVVLNMIQSALAETKWVAKMQLILAKVPILRIHFNDPFSDITVDLNANNSVAIRNTHLLCYYSSFDWRVRPLVTIVKEWAKRRDINDANRSSFTSYSLVLMVIHFLQYGLMQPILPSLQQKYPKRFNANADVRSLNVSSLLEPPEGWITDETTTLGELLIGFLEYYAFKFDYLTDAISVRLGGKLARKVVARQASPYNSNIAQWNCICIEEPFTLSNTAHSVHNQMVFDAIRIAFVDAFYELDANRDLKAFLDVGPIDISFGSSVQMNLLAISVADSPKTSSSKSTILMGNQEMLTAESKEEDYELIEANGPTLPSTAGFEMESQAIGLILSEQTTAGKNDVESQRNVTVRDEIDAIDIVLDESTTQFASDSQENIVPEGVESGIPPNVLGSDNTSGSIGHTSKSVLSERQPIELQANLSSRPYIDPSGVYETNRQQEDTKGEHLFPDRFLRRRRSGRRTHVSMGCEVRSHSGGSSLTQSMRYHRSGAISS